MATRTVRLDDETEKILDQLVGATGLSISAVLKKGLLALRERLEEPSDRSAWDLYSELDLGTGGYAIAPSTETRQGMQEALRRKHGR
jgi:Arc/MetJ-type ribon-helix-helix transcriptional regulator